MGGAPAGALTIPLVSRSPWDVERSLKRYVALALPEYEVRLAEELGTFDRPFASVDEETTTTTLNVRPKSWADMDVPYVVRLFPVPYADPAQSKHGAHIDRDALWTAFEVGVADGYPRRVPLFDYDGLAMDEEGTVHTPRGSYARVLAHTARLLADPEDDAGLLWEVVVSVRLGWRRRGAVESGPLASGFDIDYAGPEPP